MPKCRNRNYRISRFKLLHASLDSIYNKETNHQYYLCAQKWKTKPNETSQFVQSNPQPSEQRINRISNHMQPHAIKDNRIE